MVKENRRRLRKKWKERRLKKSATDVEVLELSLPPTRNTMRSAPSVEVQEKENPNLIKNILGPNMDKTEKWEILIRSIRRGAKILNIDLTEADMPEYLNWKVASDMNKNLWSLIYSRRRE